MKPETQSLASVAVQLEACEWSLLDPTLRRERARAAALLAEGFQEFGSSGTVWTREAILNLFESENYAPPLMEDFACHWIADGAALVTYRTVRVNGDSGERSVVLRSSIWVEEAGAWRVRFHQGTPVPI